MSDIAISDLVEAAVKGEFWSDGYFARSVGDKVTADIIRKYIEYQVHEKDSLQIRMFEKS
jgi:REP element-mobilizing transposase RayT